jgi:hypothetical protein
MSGKRIRVGKGRSEVIIDGVLAEGLLAELRDALGAELYDVMAGEGRRLTESARSTWPVFTGRSRDALSYDVRVVSGRHTVETVVSTLGYARYIKSSKIRTVETFKKTRAWLPAVADIVFSPEMGQGPDPIDYAKRIRSPLTELRQATYASRKLLAPKLRDAFAASLQRQGV